MTDKELEFLLRTASGMERFMLNGEDDAKMLRRIVNLQMAQRRFLLGLADRLHVAGAKNIADQLAHVAREE